MLFIDGHVHIHDCHDLAVMFDAAHANFRKQAARSGREFTGMLLLAERGGQHWFDRLAGEAAGLPAAGGWQALKRPEKDSLLLAKKSGEQLVVVAGRQLVSSEGLEVLALLTEKEFEDGLPAAVLIEQVGSAGGVPVVPWAFGKWWGARGKILQQLIHSRKVDMYLGDNGGRPAFLPCPGLLRAAAAMHWKVLAGTDPLPIAGDEARTGTFGMQVDAAPDPAAPAARLRALLKDDGVRFAQYGEPMAAARFIRNQLALRGLNLGGRKR